MKKLLIIRHAKSSWDTAALSDFERTLNDRGKKDAPAMAQRLLDKKISIDLFVASPAERAKNTAELFCKQYKVKSADIHFVSALYHADVDTFYQVVTSLDNNHNTVAVFSHNPGITDFVNSLTNIRIDNMPTCGIFAVTVAANNWKDFAKANKEFLFFDYPKM